MRYPHARCSISLASPSTLGYFLPELTAMQLRKRSRLAFRKNQFQLPLLTTLSYAKYPKQNGLSGALSHSKRFVQFFRTTTTRSKQRQETEALHIFPHITTLRSSPISHAVPQGGPYEAQQMGNRTCLIGHLFTGHGEHKSIKTGRYGRQQCRTPNIASFPVSGIKH